jgi:pimeloyl-ACP methyl ester carboxylesterase
MRKQIYKNNLRLSYTLEGKGPNIVLIHGFLENALIWSDFSKKLSADFRVLSVDLPGHGNSELYEKPFTMCKYAQSVLDIMNEEHIEKAFMIGHSMGGYVCMAFVENFPERLSAFCLFHSIPFADTDQKKDSRNELIKKLKLGKKDEICDLHMINVFAKDTAKDFQSEIQTASMHAKEISTEGIIASIETMRDRKDRSKLLKNAMLPFLYVLGLKDSFIPNNILEFIDMPQKSEILRLEDSGHMGMIEEKEKSADAIRSFYKEYIEPTL